MIATASPRNRRAGGARAWIVARRGFRGFRFRAFRGFRGRPATATAQRLPFHDSFMPGAPEARRRAARASAAARRARSAAGDGTARPGPITRLINAKKISFVRRVYFDMSVTESNMRKTHLSDSFFFFWPVGLTGAGVPGLW